MKKNSITKNVAYNLIYQVLTVILPLITTPYLSRVLGTEPIGIYSFTFSIATYFVLFGSLGTAMYGQREIAKSEDDKRLSSKTFYEVLIIRVVAMAISMIIFYLAFCYNGQYTTYYKIFLLYMVAYALNISWFFQGMEHFEKIVVRNIIVKLISVILIFLLVKNSSHLWIYILIFSGSEFLGNVSLWFYLPKYLKKVEFKQLDLKKHFLPVLLLFLPQVATQIYTVLDKTMVGIITNDMSQVGFYEQAQNIAKAALVIMASVQTVMNSRVAYANAIGDNEEIKACLKKSFDFVWMIGAPMMFGIMTVADNLVPWYYGKGFEPVKDVLIFISPIILAIGLNGITGIVFLIHTGRQNQFTKSVVYGAIINVIFNVIFIKKFGVIGAAFSSVIAETFIFVYHLKYVKIIYKISDIFKVSLKPIFSSVIMFIVLLFMSRLLSPTIINTTILVFIGGIIYTICLYMTKYELFLNVLHSGIKFLSKGD